MHGSYRLERRDQRLPKLAECLDDEVDGVLRLLDQRLERIGNCDL